MARYVSPKTKRYRRGTSPRPTEMTKTNFENNADDLLPRTHLRRLDRIFVRNPIFFVTVCVQNRQPLLIRNDIAQIVRAVLKDAAEGTGWRVGRYVIMPDHIHFFCARDKQASALSEFLGRFKSCTTRKAWDRGRAGRLWQQEFFDHLLRSNESYAQKWEYVRRNPVRAGLCAKPEDWPHQGEIEPL